jgi:hypothetical protein
LRDRRLCALGVESLRLREAPSVATPAPHVPDVAETGMRIGTTAVIAIRRLALQPDQAELDDPALRKMYEALTEAVDKAGLQCVRVCEVADDPGAAVMVFGAAALPEGVPPVRVLRVDPLSVLHGDRERKRRLWEKMQALGRGGGD